MRTVSYLYFLLLTVFVLLGSAQISSASISVSVGSPGNGATVGSPVAFNASASSANGISGWVIDVDDQNRYQVDNNVGGSSQSSGGGGLPTPPSSARVFSKVEESTSNWSDCSDCAGGTYTGNYWKAFWQTSPSMDGASLQLFNGGGPWADVLWIKKFGNQNQATNFLWDFYVYFDSTTAANLWSAEYDLWQSVGGWEFMIGTQCVFGTGEWDTWDQRAGRWVKTSVPLPPHVTRQLAPHPDVPAAPQRQSLSLQHPRCRRPTLQPQPNLLRRMVRLGR